MAGNLNNLQAFRFGLDGTAGPFDFVCTRGWLVLDQIASTNTTVGAATVTLQRSTAAAPTTFNAVGAALAADTVDDVEYVATLTVAQQEFSVGDTMRAVVVNATEADLFVEVLPTSWVVG